MVSLLFASTLIRILTCSRTCRAIIFDLQVRNVIFTFQILHLFIEAITSTEFCAKYLDKYLDNLYLCYTGTDALDEIMSIMN